MNIRLLLLGICFGWIPTLTWGGTIEGYVKNEDEQLVVKADVYLEEVATLVQTNENGFFQFSNLPTGNYTLVIYATGYNIYRQVLSVNSETVQLNITVEKLSRSLSTVEVASESTLNGIRHLRGVEGVAIYAAKKSEVIQLDQLNANLATNNAREIYRGVAGLNVWENDGGGLQLAIGVRGLDPNRSSNFNTRQNGFDISADALGYPESYYTPPAQALQRIELVRGAASLQYGTQFGGLLNFKLKEGKPNDPFEFTTENTIGSLGFINSFNSVSGTKEKASYYAFFQRKQGNGWRPNSGFEQNTAYLDVHYQFTAALRMGIELTHMNYLAQQAGGLMDFEFAENPRQSKRARNWFQVNWKLAALHFDYDISAKTHLNIRNFMLYAERDALGELGPINRPDPLRERDLIVGQYRNFGSEGRLIHKYQIRNNIANFLVGYRYYQGYTRNKQGDAAASAKPDFDFLNPDNLEQSDYEFPSRNIAVFTENLFNIGQKWMITPGVRLEYIRTSSDGYYKQRVFSGGEVIFERQLQDAKLNERQFALMGLGVGYRMYPEIEAYTNISQNYRSINFSDLAVVNPNLIVDSLLQDERGYNADLGIRGTLAKGLIRFDVSTFYLRYNNRIGLAEIVVPDASTVERLVAFRTNIGDARIIGTEAYIEADVWRLWKGKTTEFSIRPFINFSSLNGIYLSGKSEFIGNQVELIPPFTLKSGFALSWKNFDANYLYTYVHQHFSDATNATFVSNATRGWIQTYQVMDVSLSYKISRFRFQTGINNLADQAYFTRRATGYPGPGIIPADGRSWYLTVKVTL